MCQLIVTLCRKKLANTASPTKLANTNDLHMRMSPDHFGAPEKMLAINMHRQPVAVRSAAPPPLAPPLHMQDGQGYARDKAKTRERGSRPPSPNASISSRTGEGSGNGEASARWRSNEDMSQTGAPVGSNKGQLDRFAHLKEEFYGLMSDLYGSTNDPDMAAVCGKL